MIVTYVCSNRPEDQIRLQLRVRNFVDAINRTGYHRANILNLEAFVENTPEAERVCDRSDLLVVYRYLHGPILMGIEYWKSRDKKVIVDFDQGIEFLVSDMPDYSLWFEEPASISSNGKDFTEARLQPIPFEQFKRGLSLVDAATVPSARLVDDWSKVATIYELPDYLNTSQYPITNQARDHDVWIGLSQAIPYASFKKSGLAAAMEKICRRYPQVRLVLSSQGNAAIEDLDIDRSQVVAYSPRSFDEWVNLLLNLDVGLAPAVTDFDLRLSSIHLLEFMIAKIPWVASKQFACQGLSRYGLWAQNSPENWESTVSQLIERLQFYRKKARGESFLYALGYDISSNIDKVLQVYSDIVNQSPG